MTTLRSFQDEITEIQHRKAAKQRVHATSDWERVKDTKDKHKTTQSTDIQADHKLANEDDSALQVGDL